TDKRTNAQPEYVSSRYVGAFEEVRYDALGRRVLLRARRDSAGIPEFSTMERFVWDGDQVLYEIRYPGGDTKSMLEADTVTVNNGSGYKCTPEEVVDGNLNCYKNKYSTFYGRVAYTHGAGIDQPLSLARVGYGQEQALYEPFAVMPHTDWRGLPEKGTSSSGTDVAATAELDWLTRRGSAFLNSQPPEQPQNWFGNLIGGMRTASGQLYKRNRYYDPQTGRFTQEDPIGLAGGINLYGFANGDPVSYSDPYGLCPQPACIGCPPPPCPGGDAVGSSGSGAIRPGQFIGAALAGVADFINRRGVDVLLLGIGTIERTQANVVSRVAGRGGADNVANGARLNAALALEEATSIFTRSGGLQPSVIAGSRMVIPGSQLNNRAVITELTKDGSRMADWGKYSTPTIRGPSGDFQMHFYYNSATRKANYNIDYKAVFNQ
ncbi:MAG: hypothetical protein AVDCRST_MAG68-145, partial [uncultured Gemmatimonadetes bacterium]